MFVIGAALEKDKPATKYEIAKAIFIADVKHLEKYGRPITFDNYSALPDGPVPSFTLSILEPHFNWGSIGLSKLWETEPAPRGGSKAIQYINPKRSADLDRLSATDTEALNKALADVWKMGFHGTRDYTHDIPAYKEAWAKRGDKKAFPMDYRHLIADDDLVSDLIDASQFV